MRALLFVFLGMCLFSGCKEAQKKESLPQGKTVLVLATSGDNPPFEFHKIEQGKDHLTGADIEIAEALAQELGVSLSLSDMDFGSLMAAIQTGRADLAMALLTPTEERKKNVDFSDPYLRSRLAILTLRDYPLPNQESLKGKTLGVQFGSTSEHILKELTQKNQDIKIVSLNKLGDLVQGLRTKRIQGIVIEEEPAQSYVKAHGDLTYHILEGYDLKFSIAFPKGSVWTEKFNHALKKLKKKGILEKIIQKWTGNASGRLDRS